MLGPRHWFSFIPLLGVAAFLLAPLARGTQMNDLDSPRTQGSKLQGRPAPRLKPAEDGWKFGRVKQGQKVADKYIVLKNTGDAELVIKRVQTTCGCVFAPDFKTKPGPVRIKPQGEYSLKLRLDTMRAEGPIKKFIVIYSNDPLQPHVMLPIEGQIDAPWQLECGTHLNLGRIQAGEPFKREVKIQVQEGLEFKILRVLVFPQGRLEAKAIERTNDAGVIEHLVEVTLPIELKPGVFEAVVRVDCSYGALPSRAFRVVASVASAVEVSPSQLDLTPLFEKGIYTATLKVCRRRGHGLQVLKVACADAQVTSTIETVKEGSEYLIQVQFKLKPGTKKIRGSLKIHLDEPGKRSVTVPFNGEVLAK